MKPAPRMLPVRCSLTAFVGRRHTVVRDQLSFSRTGVQHSPGSSTIELPSTLVESGAYPPDRALTSSPRQCPLPLACRHLPKGTKLERGRGEHLGTPSSANHTAAGTDRLTRDDSQLAAFLEGDPGPTPGGKTLPHSHPETQISEGEVRNGEYLSPLRPNFQQP